MVVLVVLAIVAATLVATQPRRDNAGGGSASPAPTTAPSLKVAGTRLVDVAGRPVRLHGVNRAGAEYECVRGEGVFDGPTDASSIAAIRSWHANAVRIPLNEDCWLGINGLKKRYAGLAYREAIAGLVARIERQGLNVILDLHWTNHGRRLASGQQPMPDADHAPAFWRSVAQRFGADRAIVFDLFNEPHGVGWRCWRDGCTIGGWRAAGMQQLVRAVRSTGAKNVLLLGGLDWAADLTGWERWRPHDPLHQLAAGWHLYNESGCTTPACWRRQLAGVSARAPALIGEMGEMDCAHHFVDRVMDWADRHRIGYVAWTWDVWTAGCEVPRLITDYRGHATTYGAGVRAHYRRWSASGHHTGSTRRRPPSPAPPRTTQAATVRDQGNAVSAEGSG